MCVGVRVREVCGWAVGSLLVLGVGCWVLGVGVVLVSEGARVCECV